MCDFGATQREVNTGRASIAAPGAIKGLFEVTRDLGRMPVHRVIEPAIIQAHEGVLINSIQAKILQVVGSIYMSTPESQALFSSKDVSGKLIGEGEVFTNVAFADAMDAIAHEGEDLFYRGDISAMIDTDCQVGGALRRCDLENYKIFRRNPITSEYRGAKFISNPPPSGGGLLISFALALLDGSEFFNKNLEVWIIY
jgi:gamma-glutamyltranspeptidase/glutathione hydrolase